MDLHIAVLLNFRVMNDYRDDPKKSDVFRQQAFVLTVNADEGHHEAGALYIFTKEIQMPGIKQKYSVISSFSKSIPRMKWILSFGVVLFLLTAAAQTVSAQETDALTNRIQILYNNRNGLPVSEANTILQTSDGYIWIGSYGGLVRYDGREFFNYSTAKNGLTSSGIRALFEDSKGNLWVGTNDKGVFLYENGTFTACSLPEGNLFRSIRCFAEDASGTVFVGASTGLAQISPDNQIQRVEAGALNTQTIYTLSFDENGALWGTAGAGIAFALKDNKPVYWMKPGDLNENENYSILADKNIIYIGTGGDVLLRLTLTDDLYHTGSYQVDAYNLGSQHTVNALHLTREGELWLGCNTGTGWFDKKMKFHIPDNAEENAFISGIMQDYEGNLWMTSTQSGVSQLIQGKFFNANQTTGLEDKSVNAIVKLGGLLYAASDYGLFIADESWNPVANDLTRLLDGLRIRHLFIDSTGKLWISTYGDLGLLRYTPSTEEILSLTEADGLLSNKVREVLELENGDTAVATTAGVNILRNAAVIESYGRAQGLESPVVLCLLQTSDGTLLAGSDGMGIYALENGEARHLSKQPDLDFSAVLRMREDPQAGGVWISAGSMLYFMNRQGIVSEITEFRYGIGSVFDILVMQDDIWLLKSNGVIIVPRTALLGEQKITAVQYGIENGLTANLTANSWSLFEDGVLYLCSVDGVFLLNTNQIPQNNVPPKTSIDEIIIQQEDGTTTVCRNPVNLILPHDTQRVTVRFSYLSFEGVPGSMQYYLENFDEQPVEISTTQAREISYTNLSGGNYVFHLSAANADGVAGENTLSIPIRKELRFFERPAVWVCLAALTVVIAIFAINLALELKTRHLKRRQQEYREITDQALKTIANTIDAKDTYTKGHSVRVAGYSLELARRLGLSEDEQEKMYYIALLHDIGKIGIPDAILNKPGKLTEEEFEIMKNHARIGGDILKDFTALPQIEDGALSHHENYDGSGYPEHKHHETIPLVARIIRVADSYDAMATNRSYRGAMNREYILSEFEKFSGIQFEPHIAQLMADIILDGFVPEEANTDKTM